MSLKSKLDFVMGLKAHHKMLLIFFVALLFRVGNIFLIPNEGILHQEDQQLYIDLGEAFLATGEFVRQDGDGYIPETERVPIFPLFLAAVFGLLGSNLWLVIGVQSIIDSITCVIIGRLTAVFVPGGLLIGGLLAAFNLNLIVTSGMVLTDTLFLFLFSAFLLVFIHYLSVRTVVALIISAALLGLAVLTRSVGYYLIPVTLLFLFVWWFLQRKELKKWLIHASVFVLSLTIVLGPLLLRNEQQFGVVSLTSQGGTHLLGWVLPLAKQFSEGSTYAKGQTEMQQRLAEAMQRDGLSELPQNPYLRSAYRSRVAIDEIKDMGVWKLFIAWASGSVVNLASPGFMIMPAVRAMEHPSFYGTPGSNILEKIFNYLTEPGAAMFASVVIVGGLVSLGFLLLQIAGCVIMLRKIHEYGAWQAAFIILIVLYFLAITGPVIGVKYRLPLEPILTIFSVIALYAWKERWVSRNLFEKL